MLKIIFLFGAGIALFLFGMLKLSNSIQRLFTARIRAYIRYAVRRPIWGLLTGVVATIFFQSSSATSVIAVGMVSAGLIHFYNALAVILGADIGTTVIVQLVVWNMGDLSPLFIMLGGTLWAMGKRHWRTTGESVFYFGLLFFGLSLVGTATEPLKNQPDVIRFFKEAGNPIIGFLFSTVFTGFVHASAIPISILVILGQQDLVSLENALPMVIGANVGTAVTALMAGMTADIGGKRTAASHLLFKAIGAVIALAGLPLFLWVLRTLCNDLAQQIALGHFLFNIFIVAIFFFFLKPFARLMERIVPGQTKTLPLWPEFLNEKNLADPETALANVQKELEREAVLAQSVFSEMAPLLFKYQEGKRTNIRYVEMVINHLRHEIITYLRNISCQALSTGLSRKLFAYTAVADDLERMANHMTSLADLARTRNMLGIAFTDAALEELRNIEQLVGANIEDARALIMDRSANRDRYRTVATREDLIDRTVREDRDRHLIRFHERMCPAEAGPVFLEMLIHLERISDHCQNIVEYLMELDEESCETVLTPHSCS